MILKHYINKDIYRATAAILLVLILIFISSRFVRYIQLAVDGTISAKAVFALLALQIPSIAGFLIPLSFFLAILLTFGRMYSDNELVVVHGLGIGQRDLAKMLMPMALVFALAAGALSTLLTPWAITKSQVLMAEQAAQAKLGVFSAGRFRENSTKDGIVYVESKSDDGTIVGVFSVSRHTSNYSGAAEQLKIQTAKTGRQWESQETAVNYLVLEQGQFKEFNSKEQSWQVTDFSSTYTRVVPEESVEVKNTTKSVSTYSLLKELGSKEWAEIHWRLAAPISIPLICLLAVPLSRTRPRQGKFGRLLPSIMIYLIYILLMMYSRKSIEAEKIPGALGFWWIHAGLTLFIYWLYRPAKKKLKVLNNSNVTNKNNKSDQSNV